MSSKINCLNCGKVGHQLKSCNESILSYGIICFNISSDLNVTNKQIEHFFYNKFLDVSEFNYSNLNNIKLLQDYYDKIKILMIRSRHSLNYVEFMRGKYPNNEYVKNMLSYMTQNEINNIKTKSFDELWTELWKSTSKIKHYQKEYNASKEKFESIVKIKNFFDVTSVYTEPEWGFPKGRRNYSEKNIVCATREFIEETTIPIQKLHILERLSCIDEEYKGTNGKDYRHVYYLAHSDKEIKVALEDSHVEISNIGWFTIPQVINLIRPYYLPRIKLTHQIYFFIINLIKSMTNNEIQFLT